jgi:methionine sulfoxide reductase heme-binding subunit
MRPWADRAGRLVPLKLAVFVGALLPAIAIAGALLAGEAGPRPFTYVIHETGDWAVRFLLAGLAVTPLRRALDWPRLIQVRRMLGLTALAYALVHLGTYVADLQFDLAKVATEIALRIYLTIGFVAVLGLVALGVTSTDGAIRRMGRSWTLLHRLVYPITALGLAHYFMQSKVDVSAATLHAGVFLVLMAYRVIVAAGRPLSPAWLAVAAVAGALATVALEVAWYGLATGVPADRILMANLDLARMVRPAWWIGAAALGVALLAVARGRLGGRPGGVRPRPAPAR